MKKQQLIPLGSALLFLLIWGIYLKTLCPTLYVGDSGELIAGSYRLGIPHPPGYPLYEQVGAVFRWLPLGEIALRFNLLSTFFTTLAVTLCVLLLTLLFNDFQLAVALGLTWALGGALWEMACTTEVYPLANALFLGLLITLELWRKTRRTGFLILASLLYGLGLSAHYSFLLFAPGIFLYLLTVGSKKDLSKLPLLVAFGLLGWLSFAYLPLRAVKQPPVNWGNALNLTNFINHVKRAEYKEVSSLRSWRQFGEQFYYLFLFVRDELPLFSGFWGLLGLLTLYKNRRNGLFWLVTGIIITVVGGGTYFLNYDLISRALGFGPKFFIPLYLMIIILLGALFSGFRGAAFGHYSKYLRLVVFILPVIGLLTHYGQNNYRQHRLACYLGKDLLNTPPQNATLFIEEEDNELFIVTYFRHVLGVRPDIAIFDPYANLFPDSYAPYFNIMNRQPPTLRYRSQVEKWSQTDKNFQPVFYTVKPYLNAPYNLTGLLYYPNDAPREKPDYIWKYYHDSQLTGSPLNYWSRYLKFTYSFHRGERLLKERRFEAAWQVLSDAYQRVGGMQWLSYNLGVIFQENAWYNQAAAFYEREINLGPPNRAAWVNLGVVYTKSKKLDQALSAFKQAESIRPGADLSNAIANTYSRMKRYSLANRYFEMAVKRDPGSADYRYNQALNMMKIDKKLAAALWRQFLAAYKNKVEPKLIRAANLNLRESLR